MCEVVHSTWSSRNKRVVASGRRRWRLRAEVEVVAVAAVIAEAEAEAATHQRRHGAQTEAIWNDAAIS